MASIKNREDFHQFLLQYCPNVYFQPPESVKLKFPCIIYSMGAIGAQYADNMSYLLHVPYELRYITSEADDELVFTLAQLPKCKHGKPYAKDNLYHHPYTIYY